jgi:tetratricopeptide (TPR) repeat protein
MRGIAIFGAMMVVSNAWAAGAPSVSVKVGKAQVITTVKAQGALLDNPTIADIHILADSHVQVRGRSNGDGTLSVLTADGKTLTYAVRVTGGSSSGAAEEATSIWRGPVFGGKKIDHARCGEPLDDERAEEALERARALLNHGQTQEAVARLEQALKIEPDAALVHLFLGAAWAKLRDQARGAASYETFVLSCPDSPKTDAVVRVLREFNRRASGTHTPP